MTVGCEVPDDRNMLNEQLWSPDRPTFRGRRLKGVYHYSGLVHLVISTGYVYCVWYVIRHLTCLAVAMATADAARITVLIAWSHGVNLH